MESRAGPRYWRGSKSARIGSKVFPGMKVGHIARRNIGVNVDRTYSHVPGLTEQWIQELLEYII